MNPLVSVIIPTYNCAAYVVDALESVLTQDYAPFEVIVVDDGSTDGTRELLARYVDRVQAFHQENRGPAAARNFGVSRSKGEYLAFLDGDDLWLPGKLAAQMAYVGAHPGIRVVYGDWLVWQPRDDGSFAPLELPSLDAGLEVEEENSGWVYSKLLLNSIITIIAAVIHRSVHERLNGFDEGLRTGSDWDFWLRASRHFEVAKLRRVVAVYRQNVRSISHKVLPESNGYRMLKRAVDNYGLRDDAGNFANARAVEQCLSELAFLHGYRHFWRGDPRVALTSMWQASRHDPWRIKSYLYLVLAAMKSCVTSRTNR